MFNDGLLCFELLAETLDGGEPRQVLLGCKGAEGMAHVHQRSECLLEMAQLKGPKKGDWVTDRAELVVALPQNPQPIYQSGLFEDGQLCARPATADVQSAHDVILAHRSAFSQEEGVNASGCF